MTTLQEGDKVRLEDESYKHAGKEFRVMEIFNSMFDSGPHVYTIVNDDAELTGIPRDSLTKLSE